MQNPKDLLHLMIAVLSEIAVGQTVSFRRHCKIRDWIKRFMKGNATIPLPDYFPYHPCPDSSSQRRIEVDVASGE